MNSLEKVYNFIVIDFPNLIFPLNNLSYYKMLNSDFAGISLFTVIYFILTRELLHLIGGFVVTFLSYELSKFQKNLDLILISLFTLLIVFQEMYLHPMMFNQNFAKGILDIVIWISPVYLYLFFRRKT